MANRVAVVGISDMKCERKRPDVTYWQMLYDAVKEAVEEAGVNPKEIPICLYGTAAEVMNRRFIMAPSIAEVLGWSGRIASISFLLIPASLIASLLTWQAISKGLLSGYLPQGTSPIPTIAISAFPIIISPYAMKS